MPRKKTDYQAIIAAICHMKGMPLAEAPQRGQKAGIGGTRGNKKMASMAGRNHAAHEKLWDAIEEKETPPKPEPGGISLNP